MEVIAKRSTADLLLAYERDELSLAQRQHVEALVASDRTLAAHLRSIRFFDLALRVAHRNAEVLADLAQRVDDWVTPICVAAARTSGQVFLERHDHQPVAVPPSEEETTLITRAEDDTELHAPCPAPHASSSLAEFLWELLEDHVKDCVFCSRKRLQALADEELRLAGLSSGEVLLRERLLDPIFGPNLAAATAVVLRQETPVPEPIPVPVGEDEPSGEWTDCLHQRGPKAFLRRLHSSIPLLLERVVSLPEQVTPEKISAFRAYLESEAVLKRLAQVSHVRNQIVVEVAEFCASEGLADRTQVRTILDRKVLDNIVWQAAARELQKSSSTATELAGYEVVRRSLAEALRSKDLDPSARIVELALAEFPALACMDLKDKVKQTAEALAPP